MLQFLIASLRNQKNVKAVSFLTPPPFLHKVIKLASFLGDDELDDTVEQLKEFEELRQKDREKLQKETASKANNDIPQPGGMCIIGHTLLKKFPCIV